MNQLFMRAYKNAHKLSHKEVLAMFNAPDGVLHGIRRDTIGIDEDGSILDGNEYFSATQQFSCRTVYCIVHIDNNEHCMHLLMSHSERKIPEQIEQTEQIV